MKEQEQVISLPRLNIKFLKLKIIGDSPLICHKWSDKAKKEMLDKQMKKAKQAKKAKNPKKEYQDSLYHIGNGTYGFPSICFKNSAVNACSHIDGVTKVEARGAFHVNGEFVTLKGKPTMREDMVRIGMGTADIRYRGEFRKWSCEIEIRYNENVVSAEQIANLFNTAGFAIGLGEWRPQRNGSFGMFHVG